jgi:hypothetical protein
MNEMLCGLIGVVDYRDFGNNGLPDGIDDLFKPVGNFISVGDFTALSANSGRYVFNNDNTISHIGSKGRTAVFQFAFAHKADHFVFSCRTLKSSDHSAGFGTYVVISHNSIPSEPQTTCRGFPVQVNPKTRQLGKG